MKLTYDFPYSFLNLTNSGERYLESIIESTEIVISIDLSPYQFNEFNESIESLDIVLEVESSQTFYRKLFLLSKEKSTIRINLDLLGTKIDYSILLISNKDGEIHINNRNEFYEFGDCIGVLEKDTISFIEEEGISGLLKIAPTIFDTISYDLSSDWLLIRLPNKTYEKFFAWQKDDSSIPFALASLGNGCIQFAIHKALNNHDLKGKIWWETIAKLLIDNGYSIDEFEEDQIPGATNKILGNCFQLMINAATPDVDQKDTSILA